MISQRIHLPDLFLTIPALLLLSLGSLVIYSSSPTLAFQQMAFGVVGFLLYLFIASINFEYFGHYIKYLYFFTLFLLIVVFIIGIESRGSVRWIPLPGFSFQPSELAKPVTILFLARFWSENRSSWLNIAKSLAWIAPFFILIFKQPDLGTALTILVIWIFTLIGSQISFIKLSVMTFLGMGILPIGWGLLKEYQRHRILTFLSPSSDPLGNGYNVIQSTIAAGSGQIIGRGLGHGTQSRLQFLPEFRTDFIFSSMAEEFGLIGCAIVISFYAILIFRILRLVSLASSHLGGLICLGVLGMIFFQVVVNMGMNIGIMPVTGITLPLLSYGGSSVIATLASLGLVASINRYDRKREYGIA